MLASPRVPRHAVVLAAWLLALSAASSASAQHASQAAGWRIEPAVGLLLDAYDAGDDDSRSGALFGLHVARRISGPFSGIASIGYARVNDVGFHPPTPSRLVLRNEWVFASAGPAVDLPVQRSIVSLGLQLGAAWHRTPISGSVGSPAPDPWIGGNEFSVTGVLVPSASVRYPLGRRVELTGGVSAYVLSFDESGETSPAFSLGMSFVP